MDRYAFVLEKLREADFRRLRTFRSDAGARFSTWLTITARRLCLDYHRGVYGRVRDTIQSDESLLVRRIRRNLLEPVDDEQALATAVDGKATSAERRAMLEERDAILRDGGVAMIPKLFWPGIERPADPNARTPSTSYIQGG